MQTRAFAERVLFGDTLADKLTRPGPLRDDVPGPALSRPPDAPGRSGLLSLAHEHAVRPFPTRRELKEEEGRARALHAFANHELLALELMALTLLRFPDAPRGFRDDIVRTLVDEQRHLRMYCARLEQLGHPFGEEPVNGWFWHCLSDLDRIETYTAAMSLTFEQANLDFADHFRYRFRALGDPDTAAILDTVYRDEIRHVAHGVRWWRETHGGAAHLDFDAWQRALPPPLTPARARGRGFDRAGRRAAGLDAGFLSRLQAWSGTKGRPPTLWWPNLDVEAEAAGLPASPARSAVVEDLAGLVGFLCREGDVLALARPWSIEHRNRLRRAGFELPRHVQPEELDEHDPFRTVRAWALDETARAAVSPHLAPEATPTPVLPGAWLRKDAWLPRLEALLAAHDPDGTAFGPAWSRPRRVDDADALDALAREHQDRDPRAVLWLKAPLGTSGLGSQRVAVDDWFGPPGPRRPTRWVRRMLAQQGALVVSPRLPRRHDLSALLDPTSRRRPVLHLLRTLVDDRGRSMGHLSASPGHTLPDPVRRALMGSGGPWRPMRALLSALARQLGEEGWRGPVGVDLFTWQDPTTARWHLHLAEVHARHTLGHVAAAVFSRIATRSHAVLLQESFQQVQLQPTHLTLDDQGRIAEACLPLTDPATARAVVLRLHVSRDPEHWRTLLPERTPASLVT